MSKPYTPVWMVFLRGKTARFCGFALATIDALISYKGMRDWGFSVLEAGTIAAFIAIVQMGVAYILSCGYDVGSDYEARFFSDGGIVGGLKRMIGVLIILFIGGFYLFDVWSNYAAFTGGKMVPVGDGWEIKALFMLLCAIALSLGDELLHLIADLVHATDAENQVNYHQSVSTLSAEAAYLQRYAAKSRQVASKQAEKDAEAWSRNGKQTKIQVEDAKPRRVKVTRRKR
jgi:hypothetical protein